MFSILAMYSDLGYTDMDLEDKKISMISYISSSEFKNGRLVCIIDDFFVTFFDILMCIRINITYLIAETCFTIYC